MNLDWFQMTCLKTSFNDGVNRRPDPDAVVSLNVPDSCSDSHRIDITMRQLAAEVLNETEIGEVAIGQIKRDIHGNVFDVAHVAYQTAFRMRDKATSRNQLGF
jgi:hypothetical protein